MAFGDFLKGLAGFAGDAIPFVGPAMDIGGFIASLFGGDDQDQLPPELQRQAEADARLAEIQMGTLDAALNHAKEQREDKTAMFERLLDNLGGGFSLRGAGVPGLPEGFGSSGAFSGIGASQNPNNELFDRLMQIAGASSARGGAPGQLGGLGQNERFAAADAAGAGAAAFSENLALMQFLKDLAGGDDSSSRGTARGISIGAPTMRDWIYGIGSGGF